MINPVNDRIKMAVSDPAGLIATATRRVRLGKGVNNATVVNIRLALMQGWTESPPGTTTMSPMATLISP